MIASFLNFGRGYKLSTIEVETGMKKLAWVVGLCPFGTNLAGAGTGSRISMGSGSSSTDRMRASTSSNDEAHQG